MLAPTGVLYATFFALEPGRSWLKPHPRNKWGRQFETYPHQDPYHYPLPLLQDLAKQAGFRLDVIEDFGHPTQTMGRFRRPKTSALVPLTFLSPWWPPSETNKSLLFMLLESILKPFQACLTFPCCFRTFLMNDNYGSVLLFNDFLGSLRQECQSFRLQTSAAGQALALVFQ